MSNKPKQDYKIIVKYQERINEKEENGKNLQELVQKLFNSYIIKEIQNISKGK